MTREHDFLRRMFDAAIGGCAHPMYCLPGSLPPPPRGRTIVVGAGKASASMARTLEEHRSEVCRTRRRPLPTRGPVRAHRDSRSGASGARRVRIGRCSQGTRIGAWVDREQFSDRFDLGRRVVAVDAATGRFDIGGQAGGQSRPFEIGRKHQRDELPAAASVGH